MTAIAPMSSTIATASRKSRSDDGTDRLTSAITLSAKAMSVAMGIPQPRDASPGGFTARNSAAGMSMPPTAARTGSAAARGSRSSPTVSSRLISRPTTKKNNVIKPSFTQ
jgi:hypothetical protein